MKIFEVHSRSLWGDYGRTLVNATSSYREDRREILDIDRFGPFVPPLYETGTATIVRDDVKELMEMNFSHSLYFQPVSYRLVYILRWDTWDLSASEPKKYPRSLTPSDYSVGVRKATPRQKDGMDLSWEVRCRGSLANKVNFAVNEPSYDPYDLDNFGLVFETADDFDAACRAGFFVNQHRSSYVYVVESARDWLASELGDWVSFTETSYRIGSGK